jgi:hypothetical protein
MVGIGAEGPATYRDMLEEDEGGWDCAARAVPWGKVYADR